jgi:hypothetical protein
MSMGRDASELRSPTGVHPWVICERREPWWRWCRLGETTDSFTRALWQCYQQRQLGTSGRNGRRSEIYAYSVSEIRQRIFNVQLRLTTWDWRLYFPFEGRCAAKFLSALKIHHCLCRVWTSDSWAHCKHTNDYTAEMTFDTVWFELLKKRH